MNGWVRVCATTDLLPGEHAVAWDGDTPIVVFNVDGEFYALEDNCSHEQFELSAGEQRGSEVECALHGARFDIRTGAPLCAPAYAFVPKFPVRIDDGAVWARDDRED